MQVFVSVFFFFFLVFLLPPLNDYSYEAALESGRGHALQCRGTLFPTRLQ